MKRTILIGLMILLVAVLASGCASTTYLVERDKWPAFNTIVVEDVKVAEGVDMPADAVAELNELLFAKIKEDLGDKYRVVRNIKNSEDKSAVRLSFDVTLWWTPIFPIRPWGIKIETTGIVERKPIFLIRIETGAGVIYPRNHVLKLAAKRVSTPIKENISF